MQGHTVWHYTLTEDIQHKHTDTMPSLQVRKSQHLPWHSQVDILRK